MVIGNGNVAADVARILALGQKELERTDVGRPCPRGPAREPRARRWSCSAGAGPAQAAFTSSELRELGHLEGVELGVDQSEVELDPVSQRWLEEQGTFTARKNVSLLREFATLPRRDDADGASLCGFLRSPVEIRGEDRVEAVDVCRNEIVRGEDGALRPQRRDEEIETIECGLVLRSVGYQAVPLPGVPFDGAASCSPTVAAGFFPPMASRSRASTRLAGSSAGRRGSSVPTAGCGGDGGLHRGGPRGREAAASVQS